MVNPNAIRKMLDPLYMWGMDERRHLVDTLRIRFDREFPLHPYAFFFHEVGPIGSRHDILRIVRFPAGDMYVRAGCFFGTLDQFQTAFTQAYGIMDVAGDQQRYFLQYRYAVGYFRAQVALFEETYPPLIDQEKINHGTYEIKGSTKIPVGNESRSGAGDGGQDSKACETAGACKRPVEEPKQDKGREEDQIVDRVAYETAIIRDFGPGYCPTCTALSHISDDVVHAFYDGLLTRYQHDIFCVWRDKHLAYHKTSGWCLTPVKSP